MLELPVATGHVLALSAGTCSCQHVPLCRPATEPEGVRSARRGSGEGIAWPFSCMRQPAPAGCGARGGSLAPTTTSSALCGPPSGNRPRPGAGLRRVGRLAGSDYTIFCTLWAAVRQPAPAGCQAAVPWGFLLRRHHVLSSASSCPAIGFGWLYHSHFTRGWLPDQFQLHSNYNLGWLAAAKKSGFVNFFFEISAIEIFVSQISGH